MNEFNFEGKKVVICGGGGFIGSWLAERFLPISNSQVTVIDIKPKEQWYQIFPNYINVEADLSKLENCMELLDGKDYVFNLAADMGGMGFIENNKGLCMLSSLTNTHLLLASREKFIQKYFYASSACVYRGDLQESSHVIPLKEDDAYPAMPEDGYGWEKLFGERMCRHFREDFNLDTRVARFHNVYGPKGTFAGGREKAPAAICRKIAECKIYGKNEIEVWGDGNQTRSFMYVDDCIDGIFKIFNSSINYPINLGSSQLVTINQLVDIVEDIAGVKVKRVYDKNAPRGVMGRNSDNSKILEELDWEPSIELQIGMEKTFEWIYDQVSNSRIL